LSNLDEALKRFHLVGFEYAGGFANHGPMGAEALESLGHQALIPAFLDLYVPRLPPAQTGEVMGELEASSMLGCSDRAADWIATFEARLREDDWRAVLSAALPVLRPGLFAAAGHGLLRTAHAVRCLEREDSPLRRRELARGLAYWSARYQTLPGSPGSLARPEATLDDFFAQLLRVAEPAARVGFFFETVRRLETVPAFARAIERMPRPAESEVDGFLGRLCRRAAGLYCAHPEARIAYVHAVTLPTAMRGLLPYLEASESREAALAVLQAVAALHAIYGERDGIETTSAQSTVSIDEEILRTAESWDEIRYRAACSIQEHAIKMAEACLRADRQGPDPIYRIAAADAAIRLEGTRSTGGC
jgi:hypothetical protein